MPVTSLVVDIVPGPASSESGELTFEDFGLYRDIACLGDRAVFVADDGVVRRAPVEVASYGPLESAVAGGLELGAHVVVQPPETLEDGAKVRVRVGG